MDIKKYFTQDISQEVTNLRSETRTKTADLEARLGRKANQDEVTNLSKILAAVIEYLDVTVEEKSVEDLSFPPPRPRMMLKTILTKK